MSHISTIRPLCIAGAAALVVASFAPAGAQAAEPLTCGATVTVNTVLTADLDCTDSGGDGLVIGAHNVVLNLNGFTISGGDGDLAPAGIRIDGRTGTRVLNGTITGFKAGMEIQQSTKTTVTGLDISAHYRGINVGGGGGHLLEKNNLHGHSGDAIRIAVSTNNVISKNTVTGNVFGIGIADFSSGTRVEKNVATGNREFGISAYSGATRTVFEKNVISNTTIDGIYVKHDTSFTHLEKNQVTTSGDDGIHVGTPSATLIKNTSTANGDLGIEAADDVTAEKNVAFGNGNPAQCTGIVCLVAP